MLQLSTIFKERNNHEVYCNKNFCVKIFTTPNSKYLIATLSIVTMGKSELTFLLVL